MLERTNMDGTDRKQLVVHKIVYPYGVSLDLPNKHVYWVDTYLDYVERVDYEGHNRRTIMKGSPVQNLYGISTFEDRLFVSSWHNDSILELRKTKGSARKIVQNITRPFNLHVFHRQMQPSGELHLLEVNCTHLRLFSPTPVPEKQWRLRPYLCTKLEQRKSDSSVFVRYRFSARWSKWEV